MTDERIGCGQAEGEMCQNGGDKNMATNQRKIYNIKLQTLRQVSTARGNTSKEDG